MNAAINRAVSVEIDGEPFEMLLTTKATAELDRELGGMERIGELLDGDDHGASIETAAKLIATLCNGATERYNYRHKDTPRRMLTAEEVEIMTTPAELTELVKSAVDAVVLGRKTHIESEQNPESVKN